MEIEIWGKFDSKGTIYGVVGAGLFLTTYLVGKFALKKKIDFACVTSASPELRVKILNP